MNGFSARMMSAIVWYPWMSLPGAEVFSAVASRLGLVSFTICSQKSTFAMQSLKIAWSNMKSAVSAMLYA